jgi:hypothetical protein
MTRQQPVGAIGPRQQPSSTGYGEQARGHTAVMKAAGRDKNVDTPIPASSREVQVLNVSATLQNEKSPASEAITLPPLHHLNEIQVHDGVEAGHGSKGTESRSIEKSVEAPLQECVDESILYVSGQLASGLNGGIYADAGVRLHYQHIQILLQKLLHQSQQLVALTDQNSLQKQRLNEMALRNKCFVDYILQVIS